jgi:hypothetical protein
LQEQAPRYSQILRFTRIASSSLNSHAYMEVAPSASCPVSLPVQSGGKQVVVHGLPPATDATKNIP